MKITRFTAASFVFAAFCSSLVACGNGAGSPGAGTGRPGSSSGAAADGNGTPITRDAHGPKLSGRDRRSRRALVGPQELGWQAPGPGE